MDNFSISIKRKDAGAENYRERCLSCGAMTDFVFPCLIAEVTDWPKVPHVNDVSPAKTDLAPATQSLIAVSGISTSLATQRSASCGANRRALTSSPDARNSTRPSPRDASTVCSILARRSSIVFRLVGGTENVCQVCQAARLSSATRL